jgi:thiamine-phosphate pyrophosphorylase
LLLPRFYPIIDTELLEARGFPPVEAAAALLDTGARVLQYRHKGQFTRARFEEAREIARLTHETGSIFMMNDRADIALLLNAGLHVGQDDLNPIDARKVIGPSRILGYSTHDENQMRAALDEPTDYIAFGPVYGTLSKHNPDPTVGLDLLRAVRNLTTKPLVAIGGITREKAAQVFEAGADSIAVIGDLYPSLLTSATLRERVHDWLSVTSTARN